jgi:DNA-binding HxlR family transcriptional regulator
MISDLPSRKSSPIPLDDCGLAAASKIIGDRWNLLIIREVFYDVRRFDDIRNDLGIPRSVLSQRLSKLVDDDILQAVAYREEGQRKRSEYHLTKKGADLLLPLTALWQWAEKHLDGQSAGLRLTQKSTGADLVVGLVPVDDVLEAKDIDISVSGRSEPDR